MALTVTPQGQPAWCRSARIADYDGATDKEDSRTEGTIPYAAAFYRMLRNDLRGTAYANGSTGLVHAENICFARHYQFLARIADSLRNNLQPATASDKLGYWVKVYDVPVRDTDTLKDIRRACAADHKILQGNTIQVLNDACSELLGDLFVRLWTIQGADLDNPPTLTYWPGDRPGPSELNLGGGTWCSERSHIVVEVTYPNTTDLEDFFDKVNTKLTRMLTRVCPVYCTFNWACNVGGGFRLDYDRLDFAGLGA